MPHQHHFLSRLDRLSVPQVDTALALYRDAALVKWLLHQVKLPEGAPRVAISLDDPVRGPFLVVTREGVFVTCLGLDMTPGDLPVVTRGQLDGILATVGDYRARVGVFLQVAEESGGSDNLVDRLFYAAENLSREEMTALSALQPLYELGLLSLLFGTVTRLEDLRKELLPILHRARKLRPTDAARALLRECWRNVYAIGHLSVLAGLSGPKLLDAFPAEERDMAMNTSFSWGGVRQGLIVHALRSVWLAGRLGRAQFAIQKQRFADSGSLFTSFDAGMALTAIAFRHARYRAEVLKMMKTAVQSPESNFYQLKASAYSSIVLDAAPELLDGLLIDLGRDVVLRMVSSVPPSSPFAFRRVEEVPVDLARTAVVNATSSFADAEGVRLPMFASLAWLGRAEPEDLYFPRAFLDVVRRPWRPEQTYTLLRPLADMYKPVQEKPTGPARKGPCPCGSGNKYKRCCGEKEREPATDSPE